MGNVTAPQVPCQQPSEKRKYAMSFANLMLGTETIVTINQITSTYRSGSGGSTDLEIFASGIDGQKITMWIQDGVVRKTYRVEVRITTSEGQKLTGDGLLKITDK